MRCGLMRGRGLAVAECPAPLCSLIREFVTIGWTAHTVEEDRGGYGVCSEGSHSVGSAA
jgi:hypothetical protein